MTARATRRLPGFRFETQPPPPAEILPRMDVAVFVGFAASGPINRPVAVEDVAHFESIFGADAPLAWDAERGETVYAYLAPAVRAFFRNGGRRCWVVRVAGAATPNYFPIPGLMRAEFDAQGQVSQLTPAFACARSEGSWSDPLRVSSAILSDPMVAVVASFDPLLLDLTLNAPSDIAVGDLLRLTFRADGYQLICVVDSINPPPVPVPNPSATVRVKGVKPVWMQAPWAKQPATGLAVARTFNHVAPNDPILAQVPVSEDITSPLSPYDWPAPGQDVPVKLDLNVALDMAPVPGTLLRVDIGADEFWLMTDESHTLNSGGSPPDAAVQVAGEGMWRLKAAPGVLPISQPECARLTFELWAQTDPAHLLHLSDLGFETRHSRFWGALPDDTQLYPEIGAQPYTGRDELWQAAADPRFPLAGRDVPDVLYFPLAMPIIPDTYLQSDTVDATALVRDGLDTFGAALFLDNALIDTGVLDLLTTADFVRYQAPVTRSLCGIHAALAIEEATLIAVPDAVQRGWKPAEPGKALEPLDSPPLRRPAWWHFLNCQPDPNPPPLRAPNGKSYPLAQPGAVLAPRLERRDLAGEPDVAIFTWSTLTNVDAVFVLEEATSPDFETSKVIYTGTEREALIYGCLPADYYYRVRAEVGGRSSDWSNALAVRVAVGSIPRVTEPSWGNFLDCGIVIIHRPYLENSEPGANGTFQLRWSNVPGATYVLEEATARDFVGAVVIYSGGEEQRVVYGRSVSDYYYRVRAVVYGVSSDWSNGVAVRVPPPASWVLKPVREYSADTLLPVQCALLRMCAARGDLFTVLTLPEHYRENDAIAHTAALTSPAFKDGCVNDARTLSFGALYHPWLFGRDDPSAAIRRTPPDGAACGVMAQRAFNRGAWVAPANEPLSGVVALTPPIKRERWLDIQEAQINLIRQEPRGFLALSSDTLSGDEDVRPINVRRLLMLLRRLALKLGTTYVFEPNDDSFQRMVARGFEGMLGQMFLRGAFAGRTAAASFQVVTDSSVNTPQSMEQGRFIVELRVAPSLPMAFLTVRLVQTGDRTMVTEVG